MAEHLLAWLSRVIDVHFAGASSLQDTADLREAVLLVAPAVLRREFASYDDILKVMAQLLLPEHGSSGHRLLQASEYIAVEALLICAVSEHCDMRADFVHIILELDHAAQKYLMGAIQDNLSAHLSEYDFQETENFEEMSARTGINTDSAVCIECNERVSMIETLQTEIQKMIQAHESRDQNMQKQLNDEKNKLVDVEIALLEKDKVIMEKDTELNTFSKRIHELESGLSNNEAIMVKMQHLQDELEVLRPQAERSVQLEETIESLRNKLDELGTVKQQLKSESNAHSETFEKLFQAEQELETLRNCRNQLEEYRSQYAELVISSQELSLRLQVQEDELFRLRHENSSLNGGQDVTREESRHLILELQATKERLRELQQGQGIGEGISELNPALMQELTHLRAENQQLKTMIDATSKDSLIALEKQLTDQKCVNNSLQQKLLTTKDSLTVALDRIGSLEESLRRLQADMKDYIRQQEDAWNMKQQELYQWKLRCASQEVHLTRRSQAMTTLLQMGHLVVRQNLEAELTQERDTLAVTSGHLDQARHTIDELSESIRDKNAQFEAACEERTRQEAEWSNRFTAMEMKHETEIQDLTLEHNSFVTGLKSDFENRFQTMETENNEKIRTMESDFATKTQNLEEESQNRINSLIDQSSRELDLERAKSMSLQSELDDEKSKRRRLEREKKMAENEVHRQKAQLQVSLLANQQAGSTHSSTDVDSLLKEYKSMQQELEAAKAEVSSLRARDMTRPNTGVSGSSGSSNTGSSTGGSRGHGEDGRPQYEGRSGLVSRAQRMNHHHHEGGQGVSEGLGMGHSNKASTGSSGLNGPVLTNFLEMSEMTDRRVEQLNREKRELLAKSLEEQKERGELNQKILVYEKEITALKSKVTKVTLEKERLERKLMKSGIDVEPSVKDVENRVAATGSNGGNINLPMKRTRMMDL